MHIVVSSFRCIHVIMQEVVSKMKISLLAVNEMPDGSLTCDLSYDEEAEAQMKIDLGVDELTPEALNQFVTRALEEYVLLMSSELEETDSLKE